MKKTRIVGRIIAGAVASAFLLGGSFAAPAQADTGWGSVRVVKESTPQYDTNDTGWGSVRFR